RLPHDGLRPIAAPGLLVVHHVVQVDLPSVPVGALPSDAGPGARLARHLRTETGGVWQAGGNDVARTDGRPPYVDRIRRVEPELVQRLQDVDEFVAEPVLERHTAAVDPPRDQQDLLMLDVDAIERTDPLGERERLGFAERRQRVPTALLLPHDRRIEALLDRRPDREAGREVVPP